jgi:hypothetical protein
LRRRQFITLLSRAAATWPLTVHAQQPTMPVIGFLSAVSPGPFAPNLAAFRRGLSQTGFIEGQNVAIEIPVGWSHWKCKKAAVKLGILWHRQKPGAPAGAPRPKRPARSFKSYCGSPEVGNMYQDTFLSWLSKHHSPTKSIVMVFSAARAWLQAMTTAAATQTIRNKLCIG